MIGAAKAQGTFADVGASEWISVLRRSLAPLLIRLGIPDFDASVLESSAPRIVTQRVAEFFYGEGFDGIRYLSKYGHDIENWALFEPAELSAVRKDAIQQNDPDLVEALGCSI